MTFSPLSPRKARAALSFFIGWTLVALPALSMTSWAGTDSVVCQSTMDADENATLMDFSIPRNTEEFNEKFPQLKITQTENKNVIFENEMGISTIEKDILDPQRIVFKNGGRASVTFLTEGAGYSSLFGYIRMKDVEHYFEYEYNKDGTIKEERLRDCDRNGIPDFHEDLYRLRSPSNPRPDVPECRYLDPNVTCPDEKNPACQTFRYFEGNSECTVRYWNKISKDGQITYGNLCDYSVGRDDGELYYVPNLLEPPGPKNNHKGIGRIIYSQSDYYKYGPNTDDAAARFYVNQKDSFEYKYEKRGIAKHMLWNVEDMCLDGKKRRINGVERQSEWCTDRTIVTGKNGNDIFKTVRVDLMENFEPGEEIIFFLLVYGGGNYVCLAPNWKTGKCEITNNESYNVYFTKQILNSSSTSYAGDDWKNGYKTLMTPPGKGIYLDALQERQGWLLQSSAVTADAFVPGLNLNSNLHRKNITYVKSSNNSLSKKTVGNSTDNFPRFPHALSANFSWAPNYWILGFEDQSVNGTGDWDYEDIAFIIEQEGGGTIRSDVVTGDANAASSGVSTNSICAGKECDSYSITNVLLKIKDKPTRKCTGMGQNYSCMSSDECSKSKITYELATDCEVWNDVLQKYVINNTPHWRSIDESECTVDSSNSEFKLCKVNLSLEGYTGSRLCWRARFETQDETKCRPLLEAFDIRYDLMRPGTYSRAAPTSMANTIFYGAWEMVPPKEKACTEQHKYDLNSGTCYLPSTHYQDGSLDYTARGHFVFRDLYQFNKEGDSLNCDCTSEEGGCAAQASCLKWWHWNAGEVLAREKIGTDESPSRHLFTTNVGGDAVRLLPLKKQSFNDYENIYREILKGGIRSDGTYESKYNFNKDSSISPENDGLFLVQWLLGWEHPGSRTTNPKIEEMERAWPMGAFEFSTPAIVGPPTLNPKLPVGERVNYKNNFLNNYYSKTLDRPTVAYMGSSDGFVHAFDAGIYRYDKKLHNNDKALKGAFMDKDGNLSVGTGTEIFGFIPGKQLHRLANNYLRQAPTALAESSPSVSDIDLGYKKEWRRFGLLNHKNGAMTALAMAAGKNSPVVFALDVTDVKYTSPRPTETSWWPLPLWELDLEKDRIFDVGGENKKLTLSEYATQKYPEIFSSQAILRLNTGSARHSPTIARLNFVEGATNMSNGENTRWVAVFSSDYGDGSSVGAVHLIDFATGLPVTTSRASGKVSTEHANGVISDSEHNLRGLYLLKKGEGVGGEIPAVDINDDGIAEVLYVPTTQGRIYKINTATNQSCVFVDLHEDLKKYVKENQSFSSLEGSGKELKYGIDFKEAHFEYQNIYSSIAVAIENSYKVHLYVGTGNDPDNASDAADKISDLYYWLAGITDTSISDAEPKGDTDRCKSPYSAFTATPLIQGQSVWGGVATSTSGSIAVTSAAGTSADACHLKSGEGSGHIYQFDDPANLQESAKETPEKVKVQATDAPVISAPIFVNGQVVAVSAAAKVETLGDGNFNQAAHFDALINMLNWQRIPSGKLIP